MRNEYLRAKIILVKEEHLKWHSPIINREFEMLVFGDKGIPVVAYPTSMGRYYQNRDFKLIESAAWFINEGLVKIYCPDSIDELSWYNKNIHPAERVKNHMLYDDLIKTEVLSRAFNETGHNRAITAGCSFGGFQAINFAFRHPELVSHTFSMGGAFDIKARLDGYYDDNVYFNNPPDFIHGLINDNLNKMGIVLGVGEHDFCLAENKRMSGLLNEKGIAHWLDIRPGAVHDWPVWREMFPSYLGMLKY